MLRSIILSYNFNSLTLPRITGSGSTVFVLFKTKEFKNYKKKLSLMKKITGLNAHT